MDRQRLQKYKLYFHLLYMFFAGWDRVGQNITELVGEFIVEMEGWEGAEVKGA